MNQLTALLNDLEILMESMPAPRKQQALQKIQELKKLLAQLKKD